MGSEDFFAARVPPLGTERPAWKREDFSRTVQKQQAMGKITQKNP